MYKVAVIGTRDTVMGFRALGLEAVPVLSGEEARRAVAKMIKPEADYAIIYLEEDFSDALSAEIEKCRDQMKPAIILIPGRKGSTGKSLRELHAAVERAIGSDIL
ncbi:MAG: V-type ATP synthase subunit F, partial [Oscillospiraceae bacterium]|nr:V-type ATP synthase subunit F [Oscillospiraceae bacterium]